MALSTRVLEIIHFEQGASLISVFCNLSLSVRRQHSPKWLQTGLQMRLSPSRSWIGENDHCDYFMKR